MNTIQLVACNQLQERNSNIEYIINYKGIEFIIRGKIEKIPVMNKYRYSILLTISHTSNDKKIDVGYIRMDHTNNIFGQYTYWCTIGAAIDSHGIPHPTFSSQLSEQDLTNLDNTNKLVDFNNKYIIAVLDWSINQWNLTSETVMVVAQPVTQTKMEI